MLKKRLAVLVAFLILVITLVSMVLLEPALHTKYKSEPPILNQVTVHDTELTDFQGHFDLLGEVMPQWKTVLKTQLAGQVLELSAVTKPGNKVKQGQKLLEIDSLPYEVQYAEAKHQLEQARLNLLTEERTASNAKRTWKKSNLKTKPNQLALNLPQIEVAKAQVEASKKQLKKAQRDLNYTVIKAPFDGYVIKRNVSKGQILNAGEDVLELISSKQYEIELGVSEKQLKLLSDDLANKSAVLKSSEDDSQKIGEAKIRSLANYLDPQTKLVSVFLEIDATSEVNNKLVSGRFVKVGLPTKELHDVLVIPESALTRQGKIWRIDDDNRLIPVAVEVLMFDQKKVVVRPVENSSNLKKWRLAIYPMAYFLNGLEVIPEYEKSDSEASL